MKNLSKEIDTIINNEISTLNKKINGVVLLEILKFKILDKLPSIIENKFFEDFEDNSIEFKFEDDSRKILSKIICSKSELTYLNSEIKNDMLLIFYEIY